MFVLYLYDVAGYEVSHERFDTAEEMMEVYDNLQEAIDSGKFAGYVDLFVQYSAEEIRTLFYTTG